MPSRLNLLGIAVIVVLCATMPWLVNDYWMRVATKVMMFAVLGSAWNLIAGYCGYPSFGQVAFFGLGAYVTAVVMVQFHWPFLVGMAIAILIAASFAALVGLAVLRLRGHYFAIASLGVAEALRQVVANMGFTGGGEGISFPLPPWTPATTTLIFYYGMGAVLAATMLTLWWALHSRLGYAWRAIRVNEQAAQIVGINSTKYKVAAWTLSAAFTGAAGAIYGYWISFIEPNSVFSVNISVELIVCSLLGGVGTILGPVIGAAVFEIMSELVWAQFLNVHGLVLATLFAAIILLLPRGLMGLFQMASVSSMVRKWKKAPA
jgi:branched-chain amino acid transport system permease protein